MLLASWGKLSPTFLQFFSIYFLISKSCFLIFFSILVFFKSLLDFRKYIEKNCKNVGDNFPQEVRSLHYDKKTSEGIYGKASPEETAELIEEGIDFATIPWVDKSEN